jgi:ribosomal protein S18 acetylase RimI-like enzyme
MTPWPPRLAVNADMAPLTLLWHQCWHEAHAAITPPTLVARRTRDAFAGRLRDVGDRLRVAGPVGAPSGLCIISGDHLDQLYIAPDARGTGLADALLRDGENRLRMAGITEAVLDCAALNHHAARFYARAGWIQCGIIMVEIDSTAPPVHIDVIRFGKHLTAGTRRDA